MAPGDERAHAHAALERRLRPLSFFLDQQLGMVCGRRPGDERAHVRALDAVERRDAGAGQNGRREIDGAAQRIAALALRARGVAPQQRRADDAAIMDRPLQQELVVAHEVAVVGGEDHHRILGEAETLRDGRAPAPRRRR